MSGIAPRIRFIKEISVKKRLFRTYCAKMLIKGSKKGLKKISSQKANDQYTKFTWVIVKNKIQTGETLIFAVKSENKTAVCPRCGQASHRLHQNQGIMVRGLPIA